MLHTDVGSVQVNLRGPSRFYWERLGANVGSLSMFFHWTSIPEVLDRSVSWRWVHGLGPVDCAGWRLHGVCLETVGRVDSARNASRDRSISAGGSSTFSH